MAGEEKVLRKICGPKTDQVTGIWRSYFLNFYGTKISDCRKIQDRMISRDYECIQYLLPQKEKRPHWKLTCRWEYSITVDPIGINGSWKVSALMYSVRNVLISKSAEFSLTRWATIRFSGRNLLPDARE